MSRSIIHYHVVSPGCPLTIAGHRRGSIAVTCGSDNEMNGRENYDWLINIWGKKHLAGFPTQSLCLGCSSTAGRRQVSPLSSCWDLSHSFLLFASRKVLTKLSFSIFNYCLMCFHYSEKTSPYKKSIDILPVWLLVANEFGAISGKALG